MEEEESIKRHFQDSPKTYSAFLSHHKVACDILARHVKQNLDPLLGKESFLGA